MQHFAHGTGLAGKKNVIGLLYVQGRVQKQKKQLPILRFSGIIKR